MLKPLILLLTLAALIFGGLFALKFYQMQAAANQFQPPPPAVVAVTEVQQQVWPSSLSAVGSLVAVSGVTVSNEIAGKIQSIQFQSGQAVQAGQLLLELNTETDRAELDGLLAQQRLAQLRFDRSQKLIDKQFVSQSDLDQNRALLDAATAAVRTQQSLIAKKQIRAPFAGELGIRQVDLGEYLVAGSAIVELQQPDPIYLDFQLPERHLPKLTPGQQVTASVQAYPQQAFRGRISAISPLINQDNRSIALRASVPNPEHQLRPGMFAQVHLLSEHSRSVLTLPDTAITYNPYGNFVFVVESGNQGFTVQNRQVETGVTRSGRIEIIKGLKPGERVVSAGQIKLRNGMSVTMDAKPAPGERVEAGTP